MKSNKELFYYLAEAVNIRYCDRELGKYLDPKIIDEKKKLRRELLDFIHELERKTEDKYEKYDIDRMFIGAIRTNTCPIRIQLMGGADLDSITIATPDKQLGFEISLAVQSYYRRKKL